MKLLSYRDSTPIMFGGRKGKIFEMHYQKLENSFSLILEEMRQPCMYALDITYISWFEIMMEFRYAISELENMLVNIINDIFEEVKNIDEGIEALYSLRKFKQRPHLENILKNKWTEVIKIKF